MKPKIIKYLGKCIGILSFAVVLTLNFSEVKVFANPVLPTMDSTWGFPKGQSQYIKTRYWKYGNMDWSSAMSNAWNELHGSPAKVSISLDSYNYNDCKIRISSNYWADDSSCGWTSPPSNGVFEINLNSSASGNSSEIGRKSTATHEICHAFGLNDCSSTKYLMFEAVNNMITITDYEDNLLINRYGK